MIAVSMWRVLAVCRLLLSTLVVHSTTAGGRLSVRLVTAIVRAVAEPLPIAVLVSGTGTNLQALLDTVHGREAQVVAVASSVAGRAGARARAETRRADARCSRAPTTADREARDEALADWLERARRPPGRARRATWSCSARPSSRAFPDAVINVHPRCCRPSPACSAIEQALALRREGVRRDRPLRRRRRRQRAGDPPARGRAAGRARAAKEVLRRCARSSTRCCRRRCGCSPAARCA